MVGAVRKDWQIKKEIAFSLFQAIALHAVANPQGCFAVLWILVVSWLDDHLFFFVELPGGLASFHP